MPFSLPALYQSSLSTGSGKGIQKIRVHTNSDFGIYSVYGPCPLSHPLFLWPSTYTFHFDLLAAMHLFILEKIFIALT